MFLTRSIRRKLVLGLTLVLVMLTILSLSGINGLMSYRRLVNDPDFRSRQAPRRADVIASLGLLIETLLPPRTRDSVGLSRPEFDRRLQLCRQTLDQFRQRIDEDPPSSHKPIAVQLISQIPVGLDRVEREVKSKGRLISPESARVALVTVNRLIVQAESLPETPSTLNAKLRTARSDYKAGLLGITAATALVLLLYIGLVRFAHRWIFNPIRVLHQGASRVAQGDFEHRVELSTNDEMAELAESFNAMTERFQEIARDLDHEVRERSSQLVRSERLAGVGFLAAGVAHEINNPLTAIKWTTESLQGRMAELLENASEEDAEVVRNYLSLIGREAFRCQQITAKLLDFSRAHDADRSRQDLTAIIAEVLALVSHMSRFRDRNIQFDHTSPCFVDANGQELKQVVLNLVANSLESIEHGGHLSIELTEQTERVVVRFDDDGCGMTQEVIDNLFEPFFTTKKTCKGTGLGLSISHRIICDHGGTIEAESGGAGQGSTFYIKLPKPRELHLPAA